MCTAAQTAPPLPPTRALHGEASPGVALGPVSYGACLVHLDLMLPGLNRQ